MSTHNICFNDELEKIIFNYHHIPTLSIPLFKSSCDFHVLLNSSCKSEIKIKTV